MPRVGPKHLELAKKWIPSAAVYGASGGLALIYFTDWKAVAMYIPFYNTKFKE